MNWLVFFVPTLHQSKCCPKILPYAQKTPLRTHANPQQAGCAPSSAHQCAPSEASCFLCLAPALRSSRMIGRSPCAALTSRWPAEAEEVESNLLAEAMPGSPVANRKCCQAPLVFEAKLASGNSARLMLPTGRSFAAWKPTQLPLLRKYSAPPPIALYSLKSRC